MLTILRNVFYKDARRIRSVPFADVPAITEDDTSAAIAFDDALRRALATLPEAQRDVVTLVDVEGLSYAETAAALGVPAGTVMSRLHRARHNSGNSCSHD